MKKLSIFLSRECKLRLVLAVLALCPLGNLEAKGINCNSLFLTLAPASFQFPVEDKSRIEILKPELIAENTEQSANDPSYVDGLKKIARHIGPNNIERVIYPFVGADGPMAFHLFPNAREVVGIDNHPFFSDLPLAGKKIPVIPNQGVTFRHTVDMDDVPEIGSRILGFLKQTLPGFRLRKIIIDEKLEQENYYSLRTSPHHHITVEFDTGKGTPVRRYIHVNISFNVTSPETRNGLGWWLDALKEMKPQAVIVKAAHHQYNGAENGFRDFIFQLLQENNGFLIEGAETKAGYKAWEFSSKFGSLDPKFPDTTSRTLTRFDFGYSKLIRLTTFKSGKPD